MKRFNFLTFALLITLFGLFSASTIVAQELKILDADLEIIKTKRNFKDTIQVEGSYEGTYMSDYSATDSKSTLYYQEILIDLRSVVKPYLSLNAELANMNPSDAYQRGGFSSEIPSEWGASRDQNGLDLYFKQAYLEYSNNPSSIIKVGRQKVSLGDRTGMIYEGYANGFTQTCGLGTWCYTLTAVNLSPNGDSALFGASIDYPVWKSGKTIEDHWAKDQKRDPDSLSVELYRIIYNAMDIPSSQYGGWVAEDVAGTTGRHLQDGLNPVYVDNQKVEYNGINVVWNAETIDLTFNYAKLSGKRKYHIGTAAAGTVADLAVPPGFMENSANLTRIQANYQYLPHIKLSMMAMISQGTTQTSATQKPWEAPNTSFHEIQKGYHGNSLIYLSGYQYTGQGHSIANLDMQGFTLSYKDPKKSFYSLDISFYSFARNKAIYNQSSVLVKNIGTEGNIKYSFNLEEDLSVTLFAAGFFANEAYSPDEFTAPTANPASVSKIGTNFRFEF